MRLTDLEPQFVRVDPGDVYTDVATLAEAHGLSFDCPCGQQRLVLWFADHGAPADEPPLARWTVSGTNYDDLTLSPSVNAGCWHGFISTGDVSTV